jgi:hypothetical protein
MATYRVTPSADRVGFDVAVVGVSGFVQTTLGFMSEAAANVRVIAFLPHVAADDDPYGDAGHYARRIP